MAAMPKLIAYLGVLSSTCIANRVFHKCQSSYINMMVSPFFELLGILVFSRYTWWHIQSYDNRLCVLSRMFLNLSMSLMWWATLLESMRISSYTEDCCLNSGEGNGGAGGITEKCTSSTLRQYINFYKSYFWFSVGFHASKWSWAYTLILLYFPGVEQFWLMWVNRDSLASIKTRVNMIQHERLLTYFNQVGRLHCLMPGWADATVSFMLSGGYNVTNTISQVRLDSTHQQLKTLSI